MKTVKKFSLVLAVIAISALLFVSAGGSDRGGTTQSGPSTLSANDRLPSIVQYPLKNAPKLTWWLDLSTHVSASYASLNDTPFAKGLIERTGVEIEFIHPAQNMAAEQFNLLIASGRMPDIIEYNWFTGYNGGPDAAIRNQLIFPLNSVLDTWAPDFKKYMADYSNINMDKMFKTDEGNYFGFAMTNIDDPVLTTSGPIIRQDWLDDVGLQRPETIDELAAVLRAFRDRKGASAPMVFTGGNNIANIYWQGAIIGAYKGFYDMYVDNGAIKYGPAEPAFKEAVALMAEWYREGLIDKSFASNRQPERDAYILNGNSGVTFGYCSSSMDMLNRAFKEKNDPKAQLRGFKYPVLRKGETSWFGQRRNQVVTDYTAVVNPRISAAAREAAVKLLNYAFTQPGMYYYNFGTEGVSYTMINNFPTMADFVMNPASGSLGQSCSRYTRSGTYGAPTEQKYDFLKQYLGAPELQNALSLWIQTDARYHIVPPITISAEEGRSYNRIKSDLNSYVLEWTTKVIAGDISVNEYDTVFLRTIRDIGVDEAVSIQNAALARYNKR